MFKFMADALKTESDVSSKRLCGFLCTFVFLGIIIAAFVNFWVKDQMAGNISTLLGFLFAAIAAFFALTIAEAPWKKGE